MPPPPYCDANFSGRVQLFPDSHIVINGTAHPLCPGGNCLWVALHPDGKKFACTGHDDGNAWEWIDREWIDRGVSRGLRGVIYDATGKLVIVRSDGTETGSEGWRYVDDTGNLVPAWKTTIGRVFEYTTHGDITIGQGANGGLHAIVDGREVEILSGDIRYIKYYRLGDEIILAYVLNSREAKFLHTNAAAIRALPSVPPPPTEPEPVPVPIPEPIPMYEITNETWEAVKTLRASFPTPLGTRHAEFLLKTCQVIGNRCGLLRKTSGTFIVLPDGTRVSQDWILFPDSSGLDYLGSGETLAIVQPGQPVIVPEHVGLYVDVSGLIVPPVDPEPGPVDPPAPPPSDELIVLIKRLGKHLGAWS